MKATSNKAWTILFSPIWANLGLGQKKLLVGVIYYLVWEFG
jgi:hypothetical protein